MLYDFSVDSYQIFDTRSRHEDTNYMAAAMTVNGKIVGSPIAKFMGDQNNGTFPVGFHFRDVEVPDGVDTSLTYFILNSGHSKPEEMKNGLSVWIEEQAKKSVATGVDIPITTDWKVFLAGFIKGLVFANCDGPITPAAGRTITWQTPALRGVAPGTKFMDRQIEKGSDSKPGCGKNSRYVVHYTVAAK